MEHEGRPKKRRKNSEKANTLCQVLRDFCENTSAHGFQYWISSDSLLERLLWVAIVACGFTLCSIMIYYVVAHWINHPSSVAIKTFSKPANQVPFPAITVCKEHSYDVGQYLRAVFDNFQYSCAEGLDCNETELLRSHFPGYFGEKAGVCSI